MYRHVIILISLILIGCTKNIYYELNKYYDDNFVNRYTEEELNNGMGGEPRKNWEKIDDNFTNKLLHFFNTTESMDYKNIEKLSFINYIVSDDGLLRLFSWRDSPQSPNATLVVSILQCINNEKPYASLLKGKIVSTQMNNDFLSSFNYREIINLNENVYLFFGSFRTDIRTNNDNYYCFFTLQLWNNEIIPFFSFGESHMTTVIPTYGNAGRINDVNVVKIGNETRIEIRYDENKIIDFLFNGKIFDGDYEKLAEVIGGP